MHKQFILGSATLALLITGCADTNMSDTQRRTATGAGVGAVLGAVVSSATGGKAWVRWAPTSDRKEWKSKSVRWSRLPKALVLV